MGKLVVTEFISLDGVIEDPGGSEGTPLGGWSFRFPAPEGQAFILAGPGRGCPGSPRAPAACRGSRPGQVRSASRGSRESSSSMRTSWRAMAAASPGSHGVATGSPASRGNRVAACTPSTAVAVAS